MVPPPMNVIVVWVGTCRQKSLSYGPTNIHITRTDFLTDNFLTARLVTYTSRSPPSIGPVLLIFRKTLPHGALDDPPFNNRHLKNQLAKITTRTTLGKNHSNSSADSNVLRWHWDQGCGHL